MRQRMRKVFHTNSAESRKEPCVQWRRKRGGCGGWSPPKILERGRRPPEINGQSVFSRIVATTHARVPYIRPHILVLEGPTPFSAGDVALIKARALS